MRGVGARVVEECVFDVERDESVDGLAREAAHDSPRPVNASEQWSGVRLHWEAPAGDLVAVDLCAGSHFEAGHFGTASVGGLLCVVAGQVPTVRVAIEWDEVWNVDDQGFWFQAGQLGSRFADSKAFSPSNANLTLVDEHLLLTSILFHSEQERVQIDEDETLVGFPGLPFPATNFVRGILFDSPLRVLPESDGSRTDINARTYRAVRYPRAGLAASLRNMCPELGSVERRVIDLAEGDEALLTDTATQALEKIQERANRFLQMLLPGGVGLEYDVGTPHQWIEGQRPSWRARLRSGSTVALSDLSFAQRRWALISIELALGWADDQGRPAAVIIDEPEQGLHRTAERDVVRGLKQLTSELGDAAVIVATHSPYFLGDAGVRQIHVRQHKGRASLHPLAAPSSDPDHSLDEWLTDAGLDLESLLTLTRLWVLVEGAHDKVVLETVLGAALADSYARVVPMRGAANTQISFAAIAQITDAPVMVLLDDASEANNIFQQLLSPTLGSRQYKSLFQRLRNGSDEMGYLADLADHVRKSGQIDRVRVFGLSRRDVLDYLDPESFGLTDSWGVRSS